MTSESVNLEEIQFFESNIRFFVMRVPREHNQKHRGDINWQ